MEIPRKNLLWVRSAIGAVAGILLWLIWQQSTLRSNELAAVNTFFLSDTLFGRVCAAVAINLGLAGDTGSRHLLGFLPVSIAFGMLFSVLEPMPRFLLWVVTSAFVAGLAEYCFQTYHFIIAFGTLTVLISCLYFCGTLIHLETEKIERSRKLATDLQIQAEQERKRIAKDLHDEALPSLSRVMRLADQLQEAHADSTIPQEIRAELESTVTEMRRVINDLHPAVLENLGLAAALQHLANALTQSSNIQVDFSERSSVPVLPPFQALCIYRIAQEALNNIARHSGATQAAVDLELHDTNLRLRISDNGSGAVRKKADSYGLRNIEDRSKLINATVEWAAPAQYSSGTMLVLNVPVAQQKRDARQEAEMTDLNPIKINPTE